MGVTGEAVRLCLSGGRGHMGELYILLNFALNLKLPSIKSTKEKKKEKESGIGDRKIWSQVTLVTWVQSAGAKSEIQSLRTAE